MFPAGFYGITDLAIASLKGVSVERQVFELCRGGSIAIQLRAKELADSDFLNLAKELKNICARFLIPLIINDRIEVAINLGLPIHLGQEDLLTIDVEILRKNKLKFGISTHSLEQAKIAEKLGASYIGVGPIFSTPTKPAYPAIGFIEAEKMARAVKIPAVFIGGLDLRHLADLRSFGARNCAMLRASLQDEDIAAFVEEVNDFLSP